MITRISRRELLKFGVAGAASTLLPNRALASGGVQLPPGQPRIKQFGKLIDENFSPAFTPFSVPLTIIPELTPTSTNAATDTYDIFARPGSVQILPGPRTTVWGYNGITPGPLIRTRKDRPITVRFHNLLPDKIVTHLHGGHSPPEFDGYPTDFIFPGATRAYHYPNKNVAGTLWYHDHAMDVTGFHLYMGLCAPYIVQDDFDDLLGLPTGAFDLPLMFADRLFNADNSLFFPPFVHEGVLGDVVLVNGCAAPFFNVARRKYRLRLINCSNAREYLFALSNGAPFVQIGQDQGLLRAPVTRQSIYMGVCERADVIVDFSQVPLGTGIILKNLVGEARSTDVMRFNVVSDAPDDSVIPSVLAATPLLREDEAVTTRSFRFERDRGQWVINKKVFEPHRIDANPRINTTEIWELVNNSGGWSHPIHIHDVYFQVLDRNGVQAPEWERARKDVVILGPNDRVRTIMRFEDYLGEYVFHCHNVEHEDMRMMGTFEVIP